MISAFRYALSDSDESSDSLFHPMIAGTLKTILEDKDLENERLAMSTLMAANHSKPQLIAPHFRQLLPPVITASMIKPELIREVQMGPFKHKIDDGLELRKVSTDSHPDDRSGCIFFARSPRRLGRLRDPLRRRRDCFPSRRRGRNIRSGHGRTERRT